MWHESSSAANLVKKIFPDNSGDIKFFLRNYFFYWRTLYNAVDSQLVQGDANISACRQLLGAN